MTSPASRPLRDEDGTIRPWEVPGQVRRDCTSHRGLLLTILGAVALIFGFASVFVTIPAIIAIPLGIAVFHMARHDLACMRRGTMDPAGRRQTVRAQLWGTFAILLGLLCWAPFALIYLTWD